MEPSAHQITRLLQAWSEGEQSALERLIPLVYEELHRLAHHYMAGERPGHTLQTTALLNEAYLRLVDSARSRQAVKRGGEARPLELEEALVVAEAPGADLVALDDALKALATLDPRTSQVVELRFFGGLSVEETAEVLKVSPVTVMRDWKFAKSWLRRELSKEKPVGA